MSLDFDAAVSAPFRMQPGLRRMADDALHLTPVGPGSRHRREKLAVLSAMPSQALQVDNALLLRAGEHLMQMVCGPERWERFVWNVTHHPQLNARPAQVDPAPWSVDAFAAAHAPRAGWRTERQTFIALPGRQQAVFTIGVDLAPLAEAIDSAAKAAALHAAIATMSDAVLAYRNLSAVHAPLLAWLAARAAAA